MNTQEKTPFGSFCKEHNCPWYDTYRDVCKSPHDPWGGECDYNWAGICPSCGKLVADCEDEDGHCPYCGAELVNDEHPLTETNNNNNIPSLLEKREWIEGYKDRWYRKKFYCPACGIKIRTESWDEKRCFGVGTILADNSMPKFCPNCGTKVKEQ